MAEHGHLFILSGPAGAGKSTLRKRLLIQMPDIAFSVSCTTRTIRVGETEAKDYFFISMERFNELRESAAFLEWAQVHGNFYGTRREDVEKCLASGRDMMLEIDVQGSRQVKEKMPGAVRIFITAPSQEELKGRLEERGTETAEQMALRLHNAEAELTQAREYDHIIVNDEIERASAELINLIKSYRFSPSMIESHTNNPLPG